MNIDKQIEFDKVKENLGVVGDILEGLRGKLYFPGSDDDHELPVCPLLG